MKEKERTFVKAFYHAMINTEVSHVKFWDREKEKEWLKRYLLSEPNAILFVYGPKSSGKTTLLMKVVEELDKSSFIYYWYDLRERVVTGYDSVLRLFFKEKGWLKRMMEIAPSMFKVPIGVFEFEPKELEKIFSRELDAFEEMRARLERDMGRGRRPVIVFDELQKLKDVYLNSSNNQRSLVKELFNFFVRLTKVLHLSHVIVMTSDTFFIEEVYTDSTLENTSVYFKVDFFNEKTAVEILSSEGIEKSTASEIVSWIGGVPWMMEEVLENKEEPMETVKALYKAVKMRIREILGNMYEEDPNKAEEVKVVLRKLLEGGRVETEGKDRKHVKELVEKEVLFYDPLDGVVSFSTKLHERAAKELLGAVG